MKILTRAKDELRIRVLNLRAIERIFNDEDFETIFDRASTTDQYMILEAVKSADKDKIQRWYSRVLESTDIGNLSIHDLRQIAKSRGIRDYQSLPKSSLILLLGSKNGKIDRTTQHNKTIVPGSESNGIPDRQDVGPA